MTRDEIIREIQDKEYFNICKKMVGGNPIYKDLYQELVITLLEYPEEKIFRIPNVNQAKYFIIGILCNQVHSNRSSFHKTYRTSIPFEERFIEKTEEYDYFTDKRIEEVEKAIESEHWFDKELFKLYLNQGTYDNIEKKTGIDRSFVFRTIKKTKQRIINKLKKVKILLIAQKEDNALKYHRQISPHARLIKTHPEISVTKVEGGILPNGKKFEASIDQMPDETLKEFNIVYYLRQISFAKGNVQRTIERCHNLGVKVIMDIDDNWNLPTNHLMYNLYKDLDVKNQTEEALQKVDYVITTTDYFAEIIKDFNKNVVVIPNCINPDDTQFHSREIDNSKIRFGWIGGVYHKADIDIISENFCRIAKDKEVRDNYQICLGGFNFPNPEYQAIEKTMTCNYYFRYSDATYTNYLFTYTPTMEHISYDKNYRRLWARDVFNYGQLYNEIDVALIPLLQNKFNGCKSELKLIEAGTMGKTVIVSDVEPYSKWIEDGVNGIKINPNRNSIDWYIAMKKLIKEPQMRRDLADGLKETIMENFNMDVHNRVRADLYKSLI